MDLVVTFLGTAASVPSAGRGTSATLVARGGSRWLVDCGEGTQRQFLASGLGLVDVDAVLITHMHGDHYLGLPGLLKTYALRGRERPLPLVGATGLGGLLHDLRRTIGRLPFAIEVREIAPATAGEAVLTAGDVRVEAYPTEHSIASIGFRVIEDDRPGIFDVSAARAAGVPEGPLWGRLQRGVAVVTPGGTRVAPEQVLGASRPGRSVVLTGDTGPCAATLTAADGASLLVHEATFTAADAARARETGHSTAAEAAELGRRADVGLLALTHISARNHPREIRAEAEAVFERVLVPRDFTQVEIPYPDRGRPVVAPPAREGGRLVAASTTASADNLT